MIKVAVMGYGTIGSGVVEVLDINKNSIAKRAGEEIGVKYILDLRDFPGDPIQEKVRIQSFESFLLPVCQPRVLTFPALILFPAAHALLQVFSPPRA